jgi:hypothetical protein
MPEREGDGPRHELFNPTTLSDFAGNDVAAQTRAVGGGGVGAIVMKNQHGA